jgi:WD40 repeat protein
VTASATSLGARWRAECDGPVSVLRPSPDGAEIAVATEDGPLAVFDAQTGAIRRRDPGHDGGTTTLDWAPDSAVLLSGGRDGHIAVWDRSSGAERARVTCDAGWVERVAFAPHGRSFAAACGRDVTLYSRDGRIADRWPQRRSTVLDLAWRPSRGAATLACVAYGAVSILRENEFATVRRELRWAGSSLVLAWSPDGRFIATGDQDATVHFWIVSRREDLMMSGYARKVRELAWSGDSRFLATGGGEAVTVWDCTPPGPAGSEPRVLERHAAPVRALAFRPGDTTLASCAADGSVVLWNTLACEPLAMLDGTGTSATALAWHADGSMVYVADAAGAVTAWAW